MRKRASHHRAITMTRTALERKGIFRNVTASQPRRLEFHRAQTRASLVHIVPMFIHIVSRLFPNASAIQSRVCDHVRVCSPHRQQSMAWSPRGIVILPSSRHEPSFANRQPLASQQTSRSTIRKTRIEWLVSQQLRLLSPLCPAVQPCSHSEHDTRKVITSEAWDLWYAAIDISIQSNFAISYRSLSISNCLTPSFSCIT